MDLRFYHDGLGQDTYEKQYKGGLEITYEDYEPGFGTPLGVARTSEMFLWVLPATPSRGRFAQLAQALREPAVMAATPQTLVESGVFGHALSLPSQTPEAPRGSRETAGLDVRLLPWPAGPARLVRLLELRRRHAHLLTSTGTPGGMTSAASPGTIPNSPPMCGCGCTSCARDAPTPSVSPKP